ncbi:MAG: hypothetical protein Q4E73_01980 [Lachnospiraceae bacterium]|nr:hypothetical protein [Lachnospiraceae bacterium]
MKNKNDYSWKHKIIVAIIALIIAISGGSITLMDQNDSSVIENLVGSNEKESEDSAASKSEGKRYSFRNSELLENHYEKHGKEMGFSSAEEYEKAASAVVTNDKALHKTEKEDGDDVYYLEKTNEFVIVSTDGYLRTYFLPNNGIDYYNRQ